MSAGSLKNLIDDGDFLLYLASNDKNARLSDVKGSIRSAFITPLGGDLDLDDNWEVALKSVCIRNVQDVVGEAVLFETALGGQEMEVSRTVLPAYDYHDFVKQIYEWLHPLKNTGTKMAPAGRE